jgi:hypothetical protein
MLAEAVRNTQAENKRLQQAKRVRRPNFIPECKNFGWFGLSSAMPHPGRQF